MSDKKVLISRMVTILAALGAWYIRLTGWTSHWRFRGGEPIRELLRGGQNVIFAFWHNRFVMMPYMYCSYFRRKKAAVIVSQSRDGELVGRLIGHFGFRAIRGSSSRGGRAALISLTRSLKEGLNTAVTPDGPRGPRYQVQDGVIALAAATGAPIVPISCASTLQLVFRKSWDHMRLPLPFTRITVAFSPPLWVESRLTRKKRSTLVRELGERLRNADREAQRWSPT